MKGESHVLGIPIPKTLVIWAFPSHTTLAIWVRVKVKVYTGNAHITRVLGMGMPKTRGCPYHWDTASFPFPSFLPSYFHVRAFSPRTHRGPYYLRAWKGTRRIPDPTYYPPTLDTSTFSPQIARQLIQDGGNLVTGVGVCTGVYNLLSSQRLPA